MALPRGRAQKDSDLHLGIRFELNGDPTDPYEVRQVEIVDTDGETVLDTITDIEHEDDSGEYYATVSGTLLDAAGRYLDRWSYTWLDGEGEQTETQDFYVQETAVLEHYGGDLQAGAGHLKGFPALAAEAQDGITQADLDAAMDVADTMIESIFGGDYDLSGWRDAPPPLVSALWEMLAAAKAIEFRGLRLGLPGEGGDPAAAGLVRQARELTEKVLHGRPERLYLRDADGDLLRPCRNRAPTQPRTAEATSDWF